jgi:hypothetical protein
MTCEAIKMADGTVALACSRTARRRQCKFCGSSAELLCDYPMSDNTCDTPLCRNCAVRKGEDIDYCPDHGHLPPRPQLKLL